MDTLVVITSAETGLIIAKISAQPQKFLFSWNDHIVKNVKILDGQNCKLLVEGHKFNKLLNKKNKEKWSSLPLKYSICEKAENERQP